LLIALAKFCEHQGRDFEKALQYAKEALRQFERGDTVSAGSARRLDEIRHRIDRLQKKLDRL
jgi:hypothetical protein